MTSTETQNSVPRDRRWLALAVLCMGVFMIVIDTTVVNVALPSIKADLGFNDTSLAWVVNAYMLTFGGFLGLGSRAYPLPWSMLSYDREQHGYCVELRREDVESAPFMTLDQADRPHLSQEPVYRHWDEYL